MGMGWENGGRLKIHAAAGARLWKRLFGGAAGVAILGNESLGEFDGSL